MDSAEYQRVFQAGKNSALLTVQEVIDEVLVRGPSSDVQEALLSLLAEIVSRMQQMQPVQPVHGEVKLEEGRPCHWD